MRGSPEPEGYLGRPQSSVDAYGWLRADHDTFLNHFHFNKAHLSELKIVGLPVNHKTETVV